jgi:hypothetical protein
MSLQIAIFSRRDCSPAVYAPLNFASTASGDLSQLRYAILDLH